MLSVAVAIYQIVEYEALILRSGDPTQLDIIFGIIALIVVFAASFVTMGPALPIISGLFLLYCFWKLFIRNITTPRI